MKPKTQLALFESEPTLIQERLGHREQNRKSPLDRNAAKAGADRGIKRAADHAGDDWVTLACGYARIWLARHSAHTFQLEQIRVDAEVNGVPAPPDRRAWGYVARKLKAEKLIEVVGYRAQASATCHGSPKPVYQVRLKR